MWKGLLKSTSKGQNRLSRLQRAKTWKGVVKRRLDDNNIGPKASWIMLPTLQMMLNVACDTVSTCFDDGLGWGSVSVFWHFGRPRNRWCEKVGLNMHGGPKGVKTRKGALKQTWRVQTFERSA